MTKDKDSVKRKLAHAAGWQAAKRLAKMVPFGGTVIAVSLVGHDIKKKGVLKGVINSGLDAIPVVGLVKNGVELFRGDFIADKKEKKNGNKK